MAIEIVRGGKYRPLPGPNTNAYRKLKHLVGEIVTVAVTNNFMGIARLDNGRWVQFKELGPINCHGFGKWFKEHSNV